MPKGVPFVCYMYIERGERNGIDLHIPVRKKRTSRNIRASLDDDNYSRLHKIRLRGVNRSDDGLFVARVAEDVVEISGTT